jgi:hypothetical protein
MRRWFFQARWLMQSVDGERSVGAATGRGRTSGLARVVAGVLRYPMKSPLPDASASGP